MRKIILTTILITTNLLLFAQLTKTEPTKKTVIGKVQPAFLPLKAELTVNELPSTNDSLYILTYKNDKYTTLTDFKSVAFSGNQALVDTLYSMLISSLNAKKGDERTFDLGHNKITIISKRMLGTKYIGFYVYDENKVLSYINSLTESELKKLFNK